MSKTKKKQTPVKKSLSPTKKSDVMKVIAAVRVRSEPNQECDILRILRVGETVEVLETVDGWHTIKDGFVKEGFLK